MTPRLVPEIEGGYPERDREGGEEEEGEGLVLEYSRSWMPFVVISRSVTLGSHCSMFLYIMAWDDGEEAQRGAVVVVAAPIWL